MVGAAERYELLWCYSVTVWLTASSSDNFRRGKEAFFGTKIVWYPIPISLGLACLAAMHFLHMRRRGEDSGSGHHRVKLEGPWHVWHSSPNCRIVPCY